MPSTVERVERYLEGDLIIERALDRGVLSLRRASRWLIEHNEWETTEEAVVSALRRHEPTNSRAGVEDGYELLRGTRTGLRTDLALVTTRRDDGVQERIKQALDRHPARDTHGVMAGTRTVSYVVEDTVAADLAKRCADQIEGIEQPLSRLLVHLPADDPAAPVALGILLNTLSHRGVQVHAVSSSDSEYALLVPGRFTNEADDVLLHLRGDKHLET